MGGISGRSCQGIGERREDGAGRPAHEIYDTKFSCCVVLVIMFILNSSRNWRSTMRESASKLPNLLLLTCCQANEDCASEGWSGPVGACAGRTR